MFGKDVHSIPSYLNSLYEELYFIYEPMPSNEEQWVLLCPTSGKRCLLPHALKGIVGIRQAGRQPKRRKTPQLFWMEVEGWQRQRVSEGKDHFCREVILMFTALS
jgi:hypothetical protein